MLVHLSVRNIATLAHVDIEFPEGLVVLTGETGAGKSLLVESLRFALGGRARGQLIREGAEQAEVIAVFSIPAEHPIQTELAAADLLDPDDPTQLVLRRVVRDSGRNLLQVNGIAVPLRVLEPLTVLLVDLTSQHDNVRLLDPRFHREPLDSLGPVRLRFDAYVDAYKHWASAKQQFEQLKQQAQSRAERLDYLKFLLEECDRTNPGANEEEHLETAWKRLVHAAEIQEHTVQLHAIFSDGTSNVENLLSDASTVLRTIRRLDPEQVEVFEERLLRLQEEVVDFGHDIRRYGEGIEADDTVRAEMEARLESLRRLRHRFGCNPEELPAAVEQARSELSQLENIDHEVEAAEETLNKAFVDLSKQGGELTKARRNASKDLLAAVHQTLQDLDMKEARLEVRLDPLEEPGPEGLEQPRLMATLNPGEGLHPLETIASGGELSRLLLALKSASHESDPVLVSVFDEVDTGIGGEAALAVGRMLRTLATNGQVLCVSHLPQIAAAAHTHLHVTKEIADGRTFTQVQSVPKEQRTEIISRLLGGDVTPKAKAHAEELLRQAVK